MTTTAPNALDTASQTCSVEGCDNPARYRGGLGLCGGHETRRRKTGVIGGPLQKRRAYNKTRPSPLLTVKQQYMLHTRYGIGVDEYEAIHSAQGGCCAICKANGTLLVVDHNHQSQDVRGLLCNGCNTLLGFIESRSHLFDVVAEYLGWE